MFAKFLENARHHAFIGATGIAAFLHSTWALGTFFSGEQPDVMTLNGFNDWAKFLGWLLPAAAMAFSLDVGQIVTSAEIRKGHRTVAKYATFFVLSVATYYLQFLYISAHVPALPAASGVRAEWLGGVQWLRDCVIWIIPLLLPLSTFLYTLSASDPVVDSDSHTVEPAPVAAPALVVAEPELPLLDEVYDPGATQPIEELQLSAGLHRLDCQYCNDWSTEKTSEADARRSLRMHQSRHCSAAAAAREAGALL
jgi:hypothetical protein